MGRCASRTLWQILDQERIWEIVSLFQWPLAVPTSETWRNFVLQGGGGRHGKHLLSHLVVMKEQFFKCPAGHHLDRFHTETDSFYCDLCRSESEYVPHGAVMWGCRECNYDVCGNCVKMNSMKIAPGTANSGNSEGCGGARFSTWLHTIDD